MSKSQTVKIALTHTMKTYTPTKIPGNGLLGTLAVIPARREAPRSNVKNPNAMCSSHDNGAVSGRSSAVSNSPDARSY